MTHVLDGSEKGSTMTREKTELEVLKEAKCCLQDCASGIRHPTLSSPHFSPHKQLLPSVWIWLLSSVLCQLSILHKVLLVKFHCGCLLELATIMSCSLDLVAHSCFSSCSQTGYLTLNEAWFLTTPSVVVSGLAPHYVSGDTHVNLGCFGLH